MDEQLTNGTVLRLLEEAGIVVAIEVGSHFYCKVNSNCPVSIALRGMLAEMGESVTELLERGDTTKKLNFSSMPDPNASLNLQLGGKTVTVDYSDVVGTEIRCEIDRLVSQARSYRESTQRYLDSLQNNYDREVSAIKRRDIPPSLQLSMTELIAFPTLVTVINQRYIFILDFHYSPMYAVSSGSRYILSKEHQEMVKRHIFLAIYMTRDYTFAEFALIDNQGRKFHHYHGHRTDCWGNQSHPRQWNGSLSQLHAHKTVLEKALRTINLDSLMQDMPPDLPTRGEIVSQMTLMGVEGEIKSKGEERNMRNTEQQENRPRWGRGW